MLLLMYVSCQLCRTFLAATMAGERSYLLKTKKPHDSLSLDIDFSPDIKQDYPLKPTHSNINLSRHERSRSDTLTSVDGAASLLSSDVHSRDIQDLLVNLERATALVRRHLRQNENEDSQTRLVRSGWLGVECDVFIQLMGSCGVCARACVCVCVCVCVPVHITCSHYLGTNVYKHIFYAMSCSYNKCSW